MGDRYYLQLECAACGKKNPPDKEYNEDPMTNCVYYAPSSGFMDFTCSFCSKINWIYETHNTTIVDEKKLKELYDKNGFS